MIYRIGRWLFGISLEQFFSSVKVKGAERIEAGPLLVVPNHANFLIDSLLISSTYSRDFYFLAKSTLFSNPLIAWFLRLCHLVPVYRRMDNQDVSKNEDTFRFAIDSLAQAKGLVIFPEGISLGERQLQPLKTGAARIALQAEESNAWKLGLKIQPVGLTYTDIDQFRSSVTIYFGEPIIIASYHDDYLRDAIETVRKLTDELEDTLKLLTVEVSDVDHQALIEKIGKLYQSRGSELDDHARLELVVKNVEKLSPLYPEKRREVEARLDDYLAMARSLGIDASTPLETVLSPVYITLSLPIVFFGLLTHYLPYRLIGPLAHRYSTHPVSLGSLKLGFGLVVFAFWYLVMFLLPIALGFRWWSGLIFACFVIFSGFYVNKNFDQIRLKILSRLWPGEKSPVNVLKMMRDELIEELEALRVE